MLAQALRGILKAIAREEVIDEYVSSNAADFADYSERHSEHRLAWTELHGKYVELVELAVQEELDDLECTTAQLFSFARAHGAEDAAARRHLQKLIALSDYSAFCAMMRERSAAEECEAEAER